MQNKIASCYATYQNNKLSIIDFIILKDNP